MTNTTIDLNKVVYMRLRYKQQDGLTRTTKPLGLTVRGQPLDPVEYAAYHIDYPHETLLERARRLDIIDIWYPVLKVVMFSRITFYVTSLHKLNALWKAWNAKNYGK